MNELRTRSLSGGVAMVIVAGSLFYDQVFVCQIMLLAIVALSLLEWSKICLQKLSWINWFIFFMGLSYVLLAGLLTEMLLFNRQIMLLLWLVCLVWATDIGAYFVGTWLKGPLLAPRISPNKTWSGFCGGMIAGATVAMIIGYMLQLRFYYEVWALLLPLVAIGGDVLESLAKRYFKVKHSGRGLPGHGGVLDRVDGFMAVVTIFGLWLWAQGDLNVTLNQF